MIDLHPPLRALFRTTLGLGLLMLMAAGPTAAQSSPPVDRFDLVLVGNNLDASPHQVSLKTNPWRSDEWTSVSPSEGVSDCASQPNLRVRSDLSTAQYLGQDIRENYIALRITTTEDGTEGTLRAAYALPSTDTWTEAACERLATLIETNPSTVRHHSVAVHTRPRPVSLSADAPFIEHLEAPIRHRKPGVMEVEWLEILFAPES